jgi:hypothetical protein
MAVNKSSRLNISSNTSSGNTLPTLRQTFNNTQNWTVPTGVQGIIVVLSGGGAGGGSANSGNNFGGSGGGGGGTGIEALGVIPGDTVAVTIGAGGNGGAGGSTSDGVAGGITTVGVGNTLLTANGGREGRAGNNNNGAGGGQSGNFTLNSRTAGTIGTQIPIPTNVVIEFSEATGAFYGVNSNASWNSLGRGANGSLVASPGTGQSNNGSSILTNIGNLLPYSGNNTNIVITNTNLYAAYSGGGGISGNWDTSNTGFTGNFPNTYRITPRDGISGLVGGGGGASLLNDLPSGAGGGGHGGFGGDMNTTSQRGGGGGGGLTGAGATNTSSAGGAGGTGGGGGGGGTHVGAGGAGGAGAVLIYY